MNPAATLHVRQEDAQQTFEWALPRFALAIPIWDMRELWRGRPDVCRSAYLAFRLERLPLDPRWDPYLERLDAANVDPEAGIAILLQSAAYIMRLGVPGLCVHADEPIGLPAIRAAWHIPESRRSADLWDRAVNGAYGSQWLLRVSLDNRQAVDDYRTESLRIAYARVRKHDTDGSVCGQESKQALAFSAKSERSAAAAVSEAKAASEAAVSEARSAAAAEGAGPGAIETWPPGVAMGRLAEEPVRFQAINLMRRMRPEHVRSGLLIGLVHEALCLELSVRREKAGLRDYPATDQDRTDLLMVVRNVVATGHVRQFLDWLKGAALRLAHGGGFRAAMRAEGFLPEGTRWQ